MSDINERREDAGLDAIEARASGATPGPWLTDGLAQCGPSDTLAIYPKEDSGAIAYVQPLWADAEFIAHAREDVPVLLARVRAAMLARPVGEKPGGTASPAVAVA